MAGLVSLEESKLAAAVVLLSPFVPMLFMGEEYGETAPFFFFTSFSGPELADAVRKGRRKEYAEFYADREFPDPQASSTFERSRLRWASLEETPHSEILRFHHDLISLRKAHACLSNCRKDLTRAAMSEQAQWIVMERDDPSGACALLIFNFSAGSQTIPVPYNDRNWRLELWSGAPAYGGDGIMEPPNDLTKEAGIPMQVLAPGYCALVYTGTTEDADGRDPSYESDISL